MNKFRKGYYGIYKGKEYEVAACSNRRYQFIKDIEFYNKHKKMLKVLRLNPLKYPSNFFDSIYSIHTKGTYKGHSCGIMNKDFVTNQYSISINVFAEEAHQLQMDNILDNSIYQKYVPIAEVDDVYEEFYYISKKEVQYIKADLLDRFVSFLFDLIPILAVTIILILPFFVWNILDSYLNPSKDINIHNTLHFYGNTIKYISLLIYFIYSIVMENSKHKGTIGKIIDLSIQKNDFSELTIKDVLIRNIFKMISILVYFLGYIWAMFSKSKKTWHDQFSNTFVAKRSIIHEYSVNELKELSKERLYYNPIGKVQVITKGILKLVNLFKNHELHPNMLIEIYNNPNLLKGKHNFFVKSYHFPDDIKLTGVDASLIVFSYYMHQKNLLQSLDYKEGNEYLLTAVNKLLATNNYPQFEVVKNYNEIQLDNYCVYEGWLDYSQPTYLEANDLLDKIGNILIYHKLLLCELGCGNDSFDLFIISLDSINEIKDINEYLNYSISFYGTYQ